MGSLLRPHSFSLSGVDVSKGMISECQNWKFTTNWKKEMNTFLEKRINQQEKEIGLIVSSDVFVYVGDLRPVFANCYNVLKMGGLFVFSIEMSSPDDEKDFRLTENGRFVHQNKFVLKTATDLGFHLEFSSSGVGRLEAGKGIQHLFFIFRK
eukprot:TRINITY_DN12080_c0_g1_i1.p1 TRINITY_DN12080_c0_g1~~TRINITY_DN12080_c0_g1_i1.p1  ORF type:complete len:152 (-),score=55.64 TRINITY_DN12080_c0_g1_i1:206-661(-)